MSDSGGGEFFAGLVVGGLVGATLALLFAPQAGEATRSQIRETSLELKSRADEAVKDARRRADEITTEAMVRAEKITSEARTKADEIMRETRRQAEELQEKGRIILEEQTTKAKKLASGGGEGPAAGGLAEEGSAADL